MGKKHEINIEVSELANTAIHRPRRKLWDYVPTWLAVRLLDWGFKPAPTPYEVWILESVFLRTYYNRFYKAVTLLNEQSATLGKVSAPGSQELN